MVDPSLIGASERIETREDLGKDEAATYAYWMAQEAIAEKEERKWIKRAREIVKRYRDERPEALHDMHRFNVLWSNVQTLKPTLYARTPKPDVERRFKDADPTGRLASVLLERCLAYFVDASNSTFDATLKSVVEDRLLPGRGVARVLYVPTFGEPLKDESENEEQRGDENDNEDFEEKESAASEVASIGDDAKRREKLREVTFEEVVAKYVFWEDYREGPARQWSEVPWVRYQSYLTREELIERFGKKKGKEVNLDFTPKGMAESVKEEPPPDLYKKAIVREYWDKSAKRVIWIPPGTPDMVLDEQDDPLKLPDFFPNPDPLLSTTTNDKRVPVPDYIEYQDQARELDSLTARIDKLVRALKVSGIYPGDEKQVLQQLIDEGTENRLIPVGDWQAWSDKGGMKTFIEWLPIKQVAETLIQLYNARDRVKAILFEITGIGDILRGMTNPNETYGAQELKATFATRRISPQQKEVARFARDLLRLMAGVIAAHFSPQTISVITGYPQLDPVPQLPPRPQLPPQLMMQMAAAPPAPVDGTSASSRPSAFNGAMPADMAGPAGAAPQPPDPQIEAYKQAFMQWQQAAQAAAAIEQQNQQKIQAFAGAVQLIKDDGVHGFRIDIESDSTIAPDEQAEKQSRVEFLSQMVPLLNQVMPVAQGNPALAALAKEITLFAARGFRVARQLEESFEKAFDAIGQMQPNPKVSGSPQQDQGPHPAEIAAKVATSGKEQDTKLQIAQLQTAQRAADAEADRRLKIIDIAGRQQFEHERLMLEAERSARETARADMLAQRQQATDASRLT